MEVHTEPTSAFTPQPGPTVDRALTPIIQLFFTRRLKVAFVVFDQSALHWIFLVHRVLR